MIKIRPSIIAVIIFLASLCSGLSAQVLSVAETFQEHNEWCWDASSACVLNYYGNVQTQCDIANYAWTRSDCCANDTFAWQHPCNNPNYLYSWIASGTVQDVLSNFGGIVSNGSGGSISLSEIQTDINNEEPFIFLWQWSTTGGHILVGHGVLGNTVYYMDPWPGEGFHFATYPWMQNGTGDEGTHTWSETLELVSPPFYYCADNFEPNNTGSTATPVFAQPLTGPADYPLTGTNIGFAGDKDWFRIDLNIAGNLQINLTNLPYNYYLYLYSDTGGSHTLDSSVLSGIQNQTVNYHNSTSSLVHLYAKVYAANGTDNWTGSCYNIEFIYTPTTSCGLTGITPNIVSPGYGNSPGQIISSPVTLSWNAVSGATNYGVYVKNMSTNTLVVNQSCVTGTTYNVNAGALTNGGQYEWYVTANTNCTSCVSDSASPLYFQFQTSGSCPLSGLTPVLVSPGSNSFPGQTLTTLTPTLTWNTVPGATNYGVYVRDLVSNVLVVDINCASSDTIYNVLPGVLNNGHQYRWNVVATSSCGSTCSSNYAGVIYFQLQTSSCILAGVIPSLLSPGINSSPGQTITTTTPTLSWSAVPGATNYDLVIKDMGTNTIVLNQSCATSGTSYSVPRGILVSGGHYQWYIDANNSCGSCISNDATPLFFVVNTNCSYTLSNSFASFSTNGGSNYFTINTTPGCSWNAVTSDPSWINLTNTTGIGTGNLIYTVSSNPGAARTGYIYMPGNTYTINQMGTSARSGLFWIGGSGNWTDSLHWSNSSGGVSCHCIPTPSTNVNFDDSSFSGGGQTVTVNQVAYCNSMSWAGATGSSTLAGSQTLNIYGSLTLNPLMNIIYTGDIYFSSSNPGNTIQTFGKTIVSNIYFSGLGGGWTLLDNINMPNHSINLNAGSFNTNGVTVNASSVVNSGSGICFLTLGNSTLNLGYSGGGCYYGNCSGGWVVYGSNLTFNAGNSTINLTGAAGYFYSPNALTYNNINFTGTSSGTINCGANSRFYNVFFAGPATLIGAATYNNVSFSSDASINSTCTYNNLSFTAGNTYTLGVNTISTINGTLSADGTCATPTQIFSGTQGSAATINKSTGSITVNYVRLRDIKATGGAIFTANLCTDFGDNNGWTLNTGVTEDLYWIGNGGSWSDPNHWSSTSGGTSSGCIPTPYTNVFFDSRSFSGGGQTVTVDQIAYCKSMNWSGAAGSSTLAGYQTLNIYGSLTLNSLMNITYTGAIYFNSNSPGNGIQTLGKTLTSNIYFNGPGGGWTLLDNINMPNNSINLDAGSFNTNGVTVNASSIVNSGSGICFLTLGTSVLNLGYSGGGCYYGNCSGGWVVYGSNLTFNSGSSTINLTGTTGYFYSPSARTYNNISFTGASGGTINCGANSVFNNVSFSGPGTLYGNATYNSVSFSGNGTLNSSSTYNSLTFTGNNNYILATGTIATINNALNAQGDAALYINITGGTFYKSGGSICVSYVRLTNNAATGGAIFNADSSVNLGGNSGWNYASCGAAPGVPGSPTLSNINCTTATLATSGTPPANVTWYWQGTSCGTRMDLGSSDYFLATSSGTYYIRAYSNISGLWSTSCSSISVNLPLAPIVEFSGNTAFCLGGSTLLTAYIAPNSGTITGYQWLLNNNNITGATSYTYNATSAGNYIVAVTNSNNCTTLSSDIDVTINPIPAAPSVGSNSPIPVGGTILLTASSVAGATYEWSGPNSYTSLLQNPSIQSATIAMSGTYQVVTEVNGCTSLPAAVSINVNSIGTATISGKIENETSEGVQLATVTASGSPVYTDITDTSGKYSFTLLQGSNYTIAPQKNDDSLVINGVSTLDYLLIQRHILGTALLNTPYKIIAADVNSSGAVTSLDLLYIRSLILGNITYFPGHKLWAFVPANYAFVNPQNPFPFPSSLNYTNVSQQVNQNFIGVKLGDVNDSWNPYLRGAETSDTVKFAIPFVTAIPQEKIAVPIKAEQFRRISGMQFTVKWDPSILSFSAIDSMSGALQVSYGETETNAGMLSIEWTDPNYGSTTLPNDSTLFYLTFQVTGNTGEISQISIVSAMTMIEVVDSNLNILGYAINNGEVKIESPTAVVGLTGNGEPKVSASPSPFIENTNLDFELFNPSKVDIDVYNELGELIEHRTGSFGIGKYQQRLGSGWSEGIYFIRFTTGGYIRTIKVIKYGEY